jgi:hypothetical protein
MLRAASMFYRMLLALVMMQIHHACSSATDVNYAAK